MALAGRHAAPRRPLRRSRWVARATTGASLPENPAWRPVVEAPVTGVGCQGRTDVGPRWHEVGDFAGGALGGDCAYDHVMRWKASNRTVVRSRRLPKKGPSGAESWPYGLTLDSVADMSTSLSALSSTVISTFLSRVALQLEVIELRHQLGSSGARSLSTLACTKLALQDLGAGRQREKQHDTLNRLWPSPFGPTR